MTGSSKLTLVDIEAEIASEHYFTAAQGHLGAGNGNFGPAELHLLTFCVLVLHNGHKEVGINHGPVDPAEFSAEDGRRYAREDAISKLWEPLGFRLRDRLASARPALTEADAAADLAGSPRPDFGVVAGDQQTAAPSYDHAESVRRQLAESTVSAINITVADSGLQPHEQRVIAEYAELVDRMKKLTAFRLGARAERLPKVESDLLRQQEEAMSRYGGVLSKRIARFGQTVDPCTCGPGEGCSNCPPAAGHAAEPSRVITPTVGRNVHYVLSEQDALKINGRRTDGASIQDRILEDKWPCGAQAHIGNKACAGDILPAMVVKVLPNEQVNLQVFLDGNDVFWATTRAEAAPGRMEPGRWHWPARS